MLTPSRLLEERPLNSKALKRKEKKATNSTVLSIFYPRRRTASQDLLKSLHKTPKQKQNNKR